MFQWTNGANAAKCGVRPFGMLVANLFAFQRCQCNSCQFFRFFCWQYNGAFALYWVTSNIYMIITYVGFNFYADYKAKKKALEAK